jgi:rhamnosyltransferase
MGKPEVSVIIPVRNEEAFIGATLSAVFAQELRRPFEVIVVDSSSSDRTAEICRGFPVRLLTIPTGAFGHGRTRNLGCGQAQGETVVFLNGDARPDGREWLATLVAALESEARAAGAYSRIIPRPSASPLAARDILTDDYLFGPRVKYGVPRETYEAMGGEERRKLCAFHSISCAIRRELLLQHPFADIPFGEDVEWAQRMIVSCRSLVYESSSCVIHSHDLGLLETLQKYYDDTRFNRRHLARWRAADAVKIPLVAAHKSLKDLLYLAESGRGFRYRARWGLCSPAYRAAEALGMLFGFLPFELRSLSLVAKRTGGG